MRVEWLRSRPGLSDTENAAAALELVNHSAGLFLVSKQTQFAPKWPGNFINQRRAAEYAAERLESRLGGSMNEEGMQESRDKNNTSGYLLPTPPPCAPRDKIL